jgi:peptidoglycan hydrolase CwlO-like protein
MKRLLLFLILPLVAMSSKTRDNVKKDRHVSFESDMNQSPLPGQVELQDDVQYLHIGYDKARETINQQSYIIKELQASVSYAHKRIDFLQESLANINKKINRLPWYKRMNCFRKKDK